MREDKKRREAKKEEERQQELEEERIREIKEVLIQLVYCHYHSILGKLPCTTFHSFYTMLCVCNLYLGMWGQNHKCFNIHGHLPGTLR